MRSDAIPPRPALGRSFLIVWAGQTVSEVGSMLSAVGVALYVYVETGSALWLGALSALAAAPFLLAMPIAPLIDRFARRKVMMGADVFAAIGPTISLGLASSGHLEIWHLAVAGFVGGAGTAIQMPASQAAVPALAPPDSLDRANSLKQMGPAVGIVAGPLLAAPIVVGFGIEAVLVIDLISFAVGVGAVLAVPFDDHRDDRPVADDGSWGTVRRWLVGDGRPLVTLMALAAVINFAMAFFNVSVLALATEIGGAAQAGLVLGAGGAAMVAGSVVAAGRGLGRDRIAVLTNALAAMAVGLAVAAVRPTLAVVGAGVVVALGAVPRANAAMATLYNERVPASMQGRVFALRGAMSQSLQPLGSLLAGLAIVGLAEPAIAADGVLAGSVGVLVGTGRERAGAVVLLACAVVLSVIVAWMRWSRTGDALRVWSRPPRSATGAAGSEMAGRATASVGPREAGESLDDAGDRARIGEDV